MTDKLTFFHAPNTRSGGVRMLIEELGADVDIQILDLKAGDQLRPEFMAINPMGKVPTVKLGDAVVTEQVAIYQFVAELFPDAGLVPPIGDPLRGPFLRWLAFYGSSFEPAVIDRAMKREAAARATSPYADYATVMATLNTQLEKGPWLLGERFTAADVLWGAALSWVTAFGLVEVSPAIAGYLERFGERPAIVRARAADTALAAKQEASQS